MAGCATVSGLCINTSIWASVRLQPRKWRTEGLYRFKYVFHLLIWRLYVLVKLVFLFTHFAERGCLACSLAGSCRQKGSGKAAKTGKTTRSMTSHARSESKGRKARQSRGWGRSLFSFLPFWKDIYLSVFAAQFYTTYDSNNKKRERIKMSFIFVLNRRTIIDQCAQWTCHRNRN